MVKNIFFVSIFFLAFGSVKAQNQKYIVTDVEEGITYTTSNVQFLQGGGIKFEANPKEIGGPNLMALMNSNAFDKLQGMAAFQINTGPKYRADIHLGEGFAYEDVTIIYCLNQSNWPCALSRVQGSKSY